MIQRDFQPQQQYRVAIYARMSDPKQNRRSPEQQIATIEQTIRRNHYPWTVIRTYIDRGIKGRYVGRRPELQAMLEDIAAGRIKVDLILVDTYERFGRAEEMTEIRRKLRESHGVLVVAANQNFADPTGLAGQAVGMVEQIRSTEEGRVKAHQVIRGKKDVLRQGHWPGGPRPFGFVLRTVVDESCSPPHLYSVPEIHPVEGPIRRR
ncbi:MAG: recombinase family protein, partial [Tepidisphaeraceae bacterium]